MRIVLIGASGTIGRAVAKELSARHEIIEVGHSKGDITVDICSQESIDNLYKQVQNIDAVVFTTGKIHFSELLRMGDKEYQIGLQDKLMGQVNTTLAGIKHINDNGVFTLVSGVISRDPIRFGSSAAMVNAAVDGFVRGAALEMPRGIRINSVSPTVVTESLDKYAPYFRGYESASAARVALAFSKSVEGLQTGQVYCVNGG